MTMKIDDDKMGESGRLDSMISSELNELSLKEREMAYEKIHGVEKITEETPSFVFQKLEALDMEICKIRDKPAYDLAETTNPDYVKDKKFRLMFLRADEFDARKAAKRLVSFMEAKKKHFGEQTLTRSLYLSDLDQDDIEALKSGVMQVLPVRDRAGRAIFFEGHTMYRKQWKTASNLVSTSEVAPMLSYSFATEF